MTTEHNEQSSPDNIEKGKDGFEIEDIGLEEAAGGGVVNNGPSCAACGGPCASSPPAG